MIIPDVNVLVYAYDEGSARHERCAEWVSASLAGHDPIALVDPVLSGFLRVATNPMIFSEPATTASAMEFVDALIDAPASVWLPANRAVWRTFSDLTRRDTAIRGNHIPDAYLAALAIANGARLATADRGFSRYEGLAWFDPSVLAA